GYPYSSDIGKAKTVEVVEMDDSSVNLVVRPRCKTSEYWEVSFSINHAVKEALDKAGIEIPYPQRDLHHYGLENIRT
ncbi:MAG: mechanosensitive ion channel family protein, partial [Thermodesulfobacteriota bacterium]|nr:mechanosensitive ion channel family protein [Thermodesulfobacteriota bacterium]